MVAIEDNGLAGPSIPGRPFRPPIVAPDTGDRWNSLCVIDPDTIIALSGTRIRGTSGLWSVTGRLLRGQSDPP